MEAAVPISDSTEPDVACGFNAFPGGVAAWVCALLQASDSFYPTGSYAHSYGLEGLVGAGVVRDRETLHTFLFSTALPALENVDLPLAAHAWRALADGSWDQIGELARWSAALKTARESRLASENIGRQRAELAARIHPDSLAVEYLRRATAAGWPFAAPISAALEGRITGAPLDAVLAAFSYSTLAGLIAAAMKLLRIGQNSAQTLLAESLAAVPSLVAHAAATPPEDIGWFSPWLEIAAARHESADARMFIS
ncbi:MAG TPA: urease accessory UreF family protein [Opitutaceae bacterium]|nr:urease accessory UreF family protein [Opitutaceae bacterium]